MEVWTGECLTEKLSCGASKYNDHQVLPLAITIISAIMAFSESEVPPPPQAAPSRSRPGLELGALPPSRETPIHSPHPTVTEPAPVHTPSSS
jgi:hypothetical protein